MVALFSDLIIPCQTYEKKLCPIVSCLLLRHSKKVLPLIQKKTAAHAAV